MTDLKDKLLKEIKDGELAMTPRAYFTLQWTALIATTLAVLVITVVIFNFIFFSIRINGHDTLLTFGPRGFGAFIRFFPWHLLILDIGLIVFTQWLLRHFRFGYRVPVLYLLAALMAGALALGLALDRATPVNDRLREGRDRLPPPVRMLYDERGPGVGSGICRCEILAIEDGVLTVEDTREGTSTLRVVLPLNDRRATTSGLSVGDIVFIAGKEEGGILRAFGVRKDVPPPSR